jgi:protein O-mannosyl-transferase
MSSSFPSLLQRPLVIALILIAISLGLYNPVGHHPFVNYDDESYVVDNSHVNGGLKWQSVQWAFTTFDEGNWHPVTWLSHMLDCELFHLNPAGHHYMNAVLHAMNVALLFWILYSATGFLWRSAMVAALFALHPVNVESVAWVAERKNLLSLFFLLLGLSAYGWYAKKPRVSGYGVVAVLLALGLMAKPQVITFPFLLLLWDYWPLRRVRTQSDASEGIEGSRLKTRSCSWLLIEKLPLFALCVPSAILTLRAQAAEGAVTSFKRYSLSFRLANAVVAYAKYLGKALWPSHLSLMYPYQPAALTKLQIALSISLLLGITLTVAASRKRYLIVGWLWFLGTMVPMIGLVQVGVQSMADRYAYLPFIGLFIAACWGVAEFAERRTASDHGTSFKVVAPVSLVILIALAFASHRQIGYWSDNLTLWSHATAVTTDNYVAEDGIGNSLLARGDLEQAMPHFRTAAAIHPTDAISNTNLAFYKLQHNDLVGALAQYKTVTENAVDGRLRAGAFLNMGLIEDKLGRTAAARDDFQTAVNLRPRNIRAWIGLGSTAQRLGDSDSAVQAYTHAVAMQPTDVTYLLLAGALQQSGRSDDAAAAVKMATQLSDNIQQTREFIKTFVNP